MSLKLYGLGQSRSFRCLWALCETKLEFDYITLVFDKEGDNSAKSVNYLNKNSQGKVPTLEHEGFVLTESLAIINYIDTLIEQEFIPKEQKARAKYDQLTSFIITELEQPLWTNGKHRFALPAEHRVKAIFPTAEFEFHKAVNALDKMISVDNYALGDEFSFADVLLAQTIHWAERFKFEIPPHYLNYRNRMYARKGAERASEMIG